METIFHIHTYINEKPLKNLTVTVGNAKQNEKKRKTGGTKLIVNGRVFN